MYDQYPFWLKNQADDASANAMVARREADKTKEQLVAIKTEITKYKTHEFKISQKKNLWRFWIRSLKFC